MAEVVKSDIWDQIELSERTCSLEQIPDIELSGMIESAGMVFVQSLRELGRTAELFAELKILFGSVEAIPIRVFLTGTCLQISEGITSNLRTIFEDFLKKWRYVDNDHYVFLEEDNNFSKCPWQSVMDSEKYLEVAEVFAMVLLGKVLHEPELAISWTEKLDMPEDKRQDMLRKLHSLYVAANSSSSLSPEALQTKEKAGETLSPTEVLEKSTNSSNHMNGCGSKLASTKVMNPSIKNLTHRSSPFWWFSTVRLKLGGIHLALPRGRIILVGLIMAFASYFFQRKASELRKFAWRQALLIRRALIDAWQLAFSVQVNPLAAVQQISAPRSNR
ncbi:protein APEM9-like isoform X2 [Phalaenopsis equestris]|uniref:protein APEM9-like isoform X2 n=1 Tax=Phalaenopsis equestris TaxID=78828 RepID=UPI0009E43765|nr:protein APEM9-like isoform X2 [Phalaenopsis equestris]